MNKYLVTLLVLALVLSPSCNSKNSDKIVFVGDTPIKEGLYVVLQDSSIENQRNGNVVTVQFNHEHVATVQSLDLFNPWHEIEFRSRDSSESLPIVIGSLPPGTKQKAFWSISRTKDHLWVYVGTQEGMDLVLQEKEMRVKDIRFELPPK